MGYVLFQELLKSMSPPIAKRIQLTQSPRSGNYLINPPMVDYRLVLVVRDIYASLVSGYLYHFTGRECHLDHYGDPLPEGQNPFANVKRWHRYLKGELDPPRRGRTLCQYLADESERAGMKAYMEYIFNSQYQTLMNNWALVRSCPLAAAACLSCASTPRFVSLEQSMN